ncbi:MAG: insulinase family protein [Gammaproteobacteria bacterium]|nr:insulinase family protein [Gammaproteobacteria bacterium]
MKSLESNLVPHAAFKLLRQKRVETLNLTMAEYRHVVTGAEHYHLAAENTENVFLVAFRTVPVDSRGVAHILEHTTLCGSERYPVRDPFFMMHRRSLNTFMNALTSSDYTAYPFASQNRKDFFNLMDIYLDAVFFSRLDPLDFSQEGHRLEFEIPDDMESPLTFKGVVYNEMKGDASSPVSVLYDTFKKYLFPTTTYHHNSGGDPEQIPDLKYQDLLMFYKTHYHPSNAVFLTYGDIPVADHQSRIERNALAKFELLDKKIEVIPEKRYFAPVRVEESYAKDADPDNNGAAIRNQTHIVLGWLLGPNTELEELLKAHLLADVLLDTSASPLRRVLETTKLGASVSPLCGLEESNHEISFMCGIEGSNPEHADALETLVMDTLEELVQEGIPYERVDAVLHQLELHQREVGGDGLPHGLQLLLAGLPAAIHRGDPFGMLDLDPVLERLREEIKAPDFISTLIKDLLVDNPHRVRLTLKPDAALPERRAHAELTKLAAIKANLTADQKQEIVKLSARLQARQNQVEDADILPRVGLEDIPAEKQLPAGTANKLDDGRVATYYSVGTNGLSYQQLITALPRIPSHLLRYLPIYTTVLTEIGSGGRDYLDTQHLQHSVTGGISAFSTLRGHIDDPSSVTGFVTLSGKALVRNQQALTQLLWETWETVHFDESDRVRELIQQSRSRREAGITSNGHIYTMMAAGSGVSPVINLNHQLSGFAGLQSFREIDDSLEDKSSLESICKHLQDLHQHIRNSPNQFLLVADEDNRTDLLQCLNDSWCQAQRTAVEYRPFEIQPATKKIQQIWTTDTQINFCARAFKTVPESNQDSAALTVLGGVLTNGFLHRAIREQGGAYGAGAGHDSSNGVFRFYSYRDPRTIETLEDFDRSVQWLLNQELAHDKVEEAILGVISAIDAPGSPAGEARQAFHSGLFGRTPAYINRCRAAILAVEVADLKRVAASYLIPANANTAMLTHASMIKSFQDNGDYQVISI